MSKFPLKIRAMRAGLFVLIAAIIVVALVTGKMLIERLTGIEITMDTTAITVVAVVGVDYLIWKLISRRMKKEVAERSESNKI
jgi:hypothetical protein